MKTVLIAGAGHGGLVAAAHLAHNGCRVTVLERGEKSLLGYDWHDVMSRSTFTAAHIPYPTEADCLPSAKMCYYSTNKKTKIVSLREVAGSNSIYIHRQDLLRHLADFAEAQGVTFLYGCEVLEAVCEGDRVTGIRYRHDGEIRTLSGDLIIDAAGWDSPVRSSLPKSFGIARDTDRSDIIYGWRGYFAERENICTDPPHNIYFFHCGDPGMDWTLTRDGFIDVLVGSFSPMTQEDIDLHLADFFAEYPYMTDTLVHGGDKVEKIPLGKTLPRFVANGYAAVGNAAGMTEPLSGSGIDLSMRAGKILADTVIASGGKTDIASLWSYEYTYMHKHARRYYSDLIIRKFLGSLSAADVDYMFDKRILTAKEFGGNSSGYNLKQLLQKVSLLRRGSLRTPLADALRRMRILSALRNTLPEKYDEKAVRKWVQLYNTVFSDK